MRKQKNNHTQHPCISPLKREGAFSQDDKAPLLQ